MNVVDSLVATLLASAFFTASLLGQNTNSPPHCTAVTMSFSLEEHDSFEQPVGDLLFKIRGSELGGSGWMFSLEDAKGHDFLYPVNPPLRLNGSQTLGAGYGVTAKQSLSYGRELLFLLKQADYGALWPYVEHALWPYSAPKPEQAAEEYFHSLDELRTGLLRLAVLRANVGPDDSVHSAEFKAEFVTPYWFHFDPSLAPQAVTCPASTLPIEQRLPARIPLADPAKYRNVQDAALWKNPYLTITRDGFDVRFQGGRMFGPLSVLARTLVGLPDSAWPYGRVIAGAENGVRGAGSVDDALIKRNREEADKILKKLGLVVDWWPSA